MVIYVINERVMRVVRVTGDRTVVTTYRRLPPGGSGPELGTALGIEVDPSGDLFVAGDVDLGGQVVRVDPVTGDRTIVTSPTVGAGDILTDTRTVVLEPAGTLLVLKVGSSPDAVYRVDVATGDRTLVSAFNQRGTGVPFLTARDLDVRSGLEFIATSAAERRLVLVRSDTGDRTTYSGCPNVGCGGIVGTGPIYFNWTGVRYEYDFDAIQAHPNEGALMRIEDLSGNRTIMSDPITGAGPLFDTPEWIDLVPPGMLVADPADGTISQRFLRNLYDPIPIPGSITVTFTPLVQGTLITDFGILPLNDIATDPLTAGRAIASATEPAGFRLPDPVHVWTLDFDAAHQAGVEILLSYDANQLGGIAESDLSVWVVPESGPALVCSPIPSLNSCPQAPVIDTQANTILLTVDQLPLSLAIGGSMASVPGLSALAVALTALALALAAGGVARAR